MKQKDYRWIRALHYKLAKCLELVEEAIPRFASPQLCAFGVIMQDDLESLREECEELLIAAKKTRQVEISSFEVRALTVIEEAEQLITGNAMLLAQLEAPSQEFAFQVVS